jgi:DNA-binding response OmpR family regulator
MGKPLILIVEDEQDGATLIEFHLHRRGYETIIAPDGRAALNALLDGKPDLVILDLLLPELNGYEVCRLAKDAPASQHIPILMLTALDTAETKVKAFKLGVDDYMTKPFEMRELMVRTESLLRRSASCPKPAKKVFLSRLDR